MLHVQRPARFVFWWPSAHMCSAMACSPQSLHPSCCLLPMLMFCLSNAGIGSSLDPQFSFAKVAAPYAQELLDVRDAQRGQDYLVQQFQQQATEVHATWYMVHRPCLSSLWPMPVLERRLHDLLNRHARYPAASSAMGVWRLSSATGALVALGSTAVHSKRTRSRTRLRLPP